MARLDADLLLLAFRTAQYANDPEDDGTVEELNMRDLTNASRAVATSIRTEIDERVELILKMRGVL